MWIVYKDSLNYTRAQLFSRIFYLPKWGALTYTQQLFSPRASSKHHCQSTKKTLTKVFLAMYVRMYFTEVRTERGGGNNTSI